ncbi:MAG: DUF58 domain-containing protein [Neomegalonema sp.]|nr:DUF58 domain-containing protein [Neomegalonema sp.]
MLPFSPERLRADAEASAAAFPPFLAEAERLAATVLMGAHGRRRAGMGETFWQYRPATPGDSLAAIDWRHSARSDHLYIRQTEWEAAQTVWLWCDRSASMRYASKLALCSKRERAAVLSAALAILLGRGGERIAAMGTDAGNPGFGAAHLERVLAALGREDPADAGAPPSVETTGGGRAVFISDFFGDLALLEESMAAFANHGVTGLLLQITDPSEESFPFQGRVRFESMGGALTYETDRADALREDYRNALAARRDRLERLAAASGWRFSIHHTDQSAAPALLWLAGGLSQRMA